MENKMKNIDELLIELWACRAAKEWAQGKTFEEVYTTCERGDWLCWLFAKTNHEDVQLLTLVKGYQANTVRHLMKDARSMKAVDIAIAFGEGKATREELRNAADAAWVATAASDARYAADAARAEAWAAWAASAAYAATARGAIYASDAAIDAGAAARSAAGSYAASYAAEQANQQQTADIFRKYISIDKFKI